MVCHRTQTPAPSETNSSFAAMAARKQPRGRREDHFVGSALHQTERVLVTTKRREAI